MSEAHPNGAIWAQGLTKRFGDVLAVEDLTFSIPAGEVFGLLGPNGAGKTTAIRMLCALIAPTLGEARVAGHTIGAQDDDVRRSVGILTESPGLYDQLSAERNLAFFARLYEVADIPGQVARYLRLLGLWERRHEPVGTFSKGMRQKLAIARALLHEPQVLFLDEPTSGLDPAAARLVREFIAGLKQQGRTILLSTHNLDEADRLCDRLAVLNTHVLALDTPAALRRRLYGRTVVVHLRQANENLVRIARDHPAVQAVETVDNKLVITLDDPETHNPSLVRDMAAAGAEIQFVGELRRTLEDVYLQLMASAGEASEREAT